jgi:hypothetical protein
MALDQVQLVMMLAAEPPSLEELRATRGCGPHCHRTGENRIWHCDCSRCHGK